MLHLAAWLALTTTDMVIAQQPADVSLPALPVPEHDLLLPPPPGLDRGSLWGSDGIGYGYHVTADVGVGMWWISGAHSPAFGPDLSLGLFNEKGWGVSGRWLQVDQSTSKMIPWAGPQRR